ncbi:MAG: Gfo/Idh/MocA family oxidoreductase [Chloroflexi bacterium]|nr:Gfo/Idh/MocA family oxidoreductase [Chloroflexota bacterium]
MTSHAKNRGWGIVGTGWLASNYIAPALAKATNTRLVAVYSRDKSRGADFAAKHGAERSYDSFDMLASDPDVKVVHLTSPNALHAEQTIRLAEAGKHVLCEKPMAITVADCERMVEACRKNKVKLGLGFQNRHHPAHIEARRLIQSGATGKIALASVQYSRSLNKSLSGWRAEPAMAGAGALVGMCIHCLDLLRFLLGQEVETVVALTDEKWTGLPLEETVLVILKFENGPFCHVVSGMHIPRSYNDVVIYGTKSRITGSCTVGMPLQGKLLVLSDASTSGMEVATSEIGNFIAEIEAFNRCIEEDREPNASGADGLEMVRLTNAILESSKQGKAVRLRPAQTNK